MQKEQLIAKFQELYGEGGEIRTYFAPGRVNLIGEHEGEILNAQKEEDRPSLAP